MGNCIKKTTITSTITKVSFLLLSFAAPWSILGDDCLPGSNIFALITLFDVCVLAGLLVRVISLPKIPPLPPLLGMLLAGVALRNIPYVNVAKDIDPSWSSALRSLALTVILIKAGLELDGKSLLSMKGVCLRLTAIPCLVETLTCCLVCYFILDFPWLWGVLLGFVLGAVTPAVIVPSLLSLQKVGYGVAKGIPTLVIAASSFDDVLAITGFSVVLSITISASSKSQEASNATNARANSTLFVTTASAFQELHSPSPGDIAMLIARGPLEMLGGVIAGILLGLFLWFIPNSQEKNVNRNRSLLVFGIGVVAVSGTRELGVPGSGALVAIVSAFVASWRWRNEKEHVSEFISFLWRGFEPFLFGLIGAEVSFEDMDSSTIGGGIAVLGLCLLLRSLATFLSVLGAGLTFKERIFVCFAWIPKATVQAALGPIALDTARNANVSEDVRKMARQILTITVLAILITAPLGAAAIALTGPKLLQKDRKEGTEEPAVSLPINKIPAEPEMSPAISLENQQSSQEKPVSVT